MGGDLAKRAERAEVLGADGGGAGEAFLDGGEDLDPLDGVDAEVGVEPHVEVEHFDRIAGLLADNGKEGSSGVNSVACRCSNRTEWLGFRDCRWCSGGRR